MSEDCPTLSLCLLWRWKNNCCAFSQFIWFSIFNCKFSVPSVQYISCRTTLTDSISSDPRWGYFSYFTYTLSSYKQPNNTQALQLLVNYSQSITSKPTEILSGLSLQDHRSMVMYNPDKHFPLLNVTLLSHLSSLDSWRVNQKISLKRKFPCSQLMERY